MVTPTYSSLYSDIASRREEARLQREMATQQERQRRRTIEETRRVSPRAPIGAGQASRQQVRSLRREVSGLQSYRRDIAGYEAGLTRQEKEIARFEQEGYQPRMQKGELVFAKEIIEPTGGVGVDARYAQTSVITWINKAGQTEVSSVNVKQEGERVSRIRSMGGNVIGISRVPVGGDVSRRVVEGKLTDVSYAGQKLLEIKEVPITEKIIETRPMTDAEIKSMLSKMTEPEKISFYKEYGRFGVDEKTWQEFRKPFYDIKIKGEEAVIVTPATSEEQLLKWWRAEYKDTDIAGGVRKVAAGAIWGAFNIEFWKRTILEGPRGGQIVVARAEYEARGAVKEGAVGVAKIALGSPGYTDIVYPFAFAGGIGLGLKGVGLAAKTATGVTGKVLTGFTKTAPYVFGGTFAAVVGTDIGYTAATTKGPLGGWGSTETVSKALTYGVQFTSAYAGYKWARGLQISESQIETMDRMKLNFNRAASRVPGYEATYEQVSIFKATGKYGVLQHGARYPSDFYYGVRGGIARFKQPIHAFVERSAWLQQQKIISKYSFEPPISMAQRYRTFAFRSPYTLTGGIRVQPRVGYALSTEAIARLAPAKGYLPKPFTDVGEVLPKLFETSDIIFTKKVPTEGGYWLEYAQKTDIKYKPFTKGLPYEYETMKGFGRIFKPDMPGKYTIGGKKIFIGSREAYDVFAGKKVHLRAFAGKVEQMGIGQAVYAESKLIIPTKLSVKTPVKRFTLWKRDIPYFETRGLPDFEKISFTKTIQNIQQEFYNFYSATKQTGMPSRTSLTIGLGRTQELFKIHSPLKAFKLTVSRYFTVGDVTTIKDVTFLPEKTIPMRGAGKIYDTTQWYGSEYMKTPVSSEQMSIFTQLKTIKASQFISPAILKSAQQQFYVPSARQLPAPEPSGQVVDTKTYTSISPFIVSVTKTTPISIQEPKVETRYMQEYIQEYDTESISKQINKVITKSMTKTIMKPMIKMDTRLVSRYDVKSITKLEQRPMTKLLEEPITKLSMRQFTKLGQRLEQKLLTRYSLKPMVGLWIPSHVPPGYKMITERPMLPPYAPPPHVPWGFGLPDGKRKKRRKKDFEDLLKGYRFRRWKVPTVKSIVPLGEFAI